MNYISYELESLTGQSYDTLIQEIWTNYQAEMLERFPYIGGDATSGTKNLIGAYMFVSMGEVLKKYGVTTAQSGHLMILIYERQFTKIPSFLRSIMGKIFTNPQFLTKMFLKKDRKNALNAAQNPGSFETQTQIPPENGYDFSYHNLVCPLADFAKNTDMKNTCLTSVIWIMSCSVFWVPHCTESIPALMMVIIVISS